MARLPRPDDRLHLGRSSLQVSPFCLGMVDAPETVLAAFDAGINFFFVSTDMHWPLYGGLRAGLASLLRRGGGVRDDIVVIATTYVAPPVFLRAPFVELVESIPGLDRVDVCAAGGCYATDSPDRARVIAEHKASGFVGCRATGASFHDRALVAPACNAGSLDVGFVRYNASHPGAHDDVFPHLEAGATPLYGFKSMGGWAPPEELARRARLPAGTWMPKPTDHYRFALSRGGLCGLLCSPSTPAQVHDLVAAMTEAPLDEEECEHMIDLALLASGDASLVPTGAEVGRE